MSRTVRASMGTARRPGQLLRLSPLLALLSLGACASVLGIEDIHDGPAPGAGGDDTGTGGKSGGGKSGGGDGNTGASNTLGGEGTGTAGDGQGGSGNQAGSGNPPIGGEGNAGDGNVPVDPTVSGRVIDFFGNPVGNVVMQIGDQTTATDGDGEFTFENVPAEYEVSLLVKRDDNGKWYGWVYQGVTRRDPTLQVYQGRDTRWCTWVSSATGATVGANDVITTSIGSADGNATDEDIDPTGSSDYHDWEGGASTNGTGHALHFTQNAATSLPSAYKAYDSKLLAFADGVSGAAEYDLSPDVIPSDTITGNVAPAGEDDRNNKVFLRFASGAAIKLADHVPAANAFTYLVPNITGGSVSVVAIEGTTYGPLGMAHKEGLSAGDAAGTLNIPLPAQPLTPSQTAVNADTAQFTFKASADNAGAFVVTLESDDVWENIYIVTTETKFTVPSVVGGALPLRAGGGYRWWVETHGDLATVDEMTGPNGFVDPYSHPSFGFVPTGPSQDDGTYTFSGYYGFTVNP